MKRNLILALAIVVMVLGITAWLSAPATVSTGHVPYAFKYLIGDIVEYDNDWWEVIGRMEYRSKVDGNIYPWYKLSRPHEGKVQELWVWACPVDNATSMMLLGGGDPDDCCDTGPPDCPQPPCAPGA